MKPLKLVMSGFGPFADREEIDFEREGLDGLFLVTGDTGSGKTTIFDAISFALYGEASGEWRSSEGFRSGYADRETKTFVEMTFLQKGRRYCIKRNPRYERPAKRGEKMVKEKPEAVLEFSDGTVISGISQVSEAIQELLGIDRRQFKQVAMIAQGEFLSLLTAKSKERGEILRKVFETEAFESLQQKLSEKEREYARKCERQDQDLLRIMQGIKEENDFPQMEQLLESRREKKTEETKEWLDCLVTWEREQEKKAEKRLRETEQEIQKQQKELERVRFEEETFLNIQKAREELEELEKEEEQKNLKEIVTAAKKAFRCVLPLEKRWKEEKEKQRDFEQQTEEQKEKLRQARSIQEKLEEERQCWELEIPNLEKKKSQILEFEEKKPFRERKKNLNEEKKEWMEQKERFQKKREKAVKKQENLLAEQKEKMAYEKAEEGIETKEQICLIKIEELEKKQKEIWQLWKEERELDRIQKAEKKLQEDYEKEREIWKEQNEKFQETQNLFFGNLAGILAEKLEEQKPCPVCGSTHHPYKAKTVHCAVTEEEWKKLREENEKKMEELYVKKTDYEKKKTEQENRKAEFLKKLDVLTLEISREGDTSAEESLKNLQKEEEKIETYLEKLERLESKNKELLDEKKRQKEEYEERLAKKRQAQERIREISEEIVRFQKEEKEAEKQENEYDKKMWICQQGLDEIEKKYPNIEEMQENEEKQISGLKREVEQSYEKIKEVQERQQKQKEEQIRLQTALEANLLQYKKQVESAENYEQIWILEYKNQGFQTEERYRDALKNEEEIDMLEDLLKKRESTKNDLNAKIKVMEEQLSSQEPKDASELERKVEETEKEKQRYQDIYNNILMRVERNCELQREIRNLTQSQKKDKCLYGKYKELSDTANGKLNGREKLAFEQYVQRFYFRQVVQKANHRFYKMSGGQYELRCMEHAGDNRRSAGLDLEIMDYYTGKECSVESLSGGESFQAALALALGLSDVIQSYAGGIDVDAVFIDEGFGSLDLNSLEQAVKVLTDLSGENRMVGIISHVSELKERIEKKVELTKTMNGSSITVKDS